jgi:hypothetical protein
MCATVAHAVDLRGRRLLCLFGVGAGLVSPTRDGICPHRTASGKALHAAQWGRAVRL